MQGQSERTGKPKGICMGGICIWMCGICTPIMALMTGSISAGTIFSRMCRLSALISSSSLYGDPASASCIMPICDAW